MSGTHPQLPAVVTLPAKECWLCGRAMVTPHCLTCGRTEDESPEPMAVDAIDLEEELAIERDRERWEAEHDSYAPEVNEVTRGTRY